MPVRMIFYTGGIASLSCSVGSSFLFLSTGGWEARLLCRLKDLKSRRCFIREGTTTRESHKERKKRESKKQETHILALPSLSPPLRAPSQSAA